MIRRTLTLTAAAIALAAAPAAAAPAPPLTLAQARWFTERAARPWGEPSIRFGSCKRLSPLTVACRFTWSTGGRRLAGAEVCELDTIADQYVRITLAGATPLTAAERAALGVS